MAGKPLLRVHAPAKINLSLRVLGVAADGDHELRTVFQSIDLHDTLTFRERTGPFSLSSDDVTCPTDDTNLAWRAADTIARAAGSAGPPRDIEIHIAKRIPMAAGLGGGSSDAAAVLRGFAALWGVRVPPERMRAMAAALGADVPFFLEGGTVLGVERGDRLFRLVDQRPAWVALLVPPFGVSTKEAYAWHDEMVRLPPSTRRGFGATGKADTSETRGVVAAVVSGFRGTDLPETGNDLQPAVALRHPEIDEIVSELTRAGAAYAAMSGSGSAVFGLFGTRAAAARAAKAAASRGRGRAVVTRFVNRVRYQTLAGL